MATLEDDLAAIGAYLDNVLDVLEDTQRILAEQVQSLSERVAALEQAVFGEVQESQPACRVIEFRPDFRPSPRGR